MTASQTARFYLYYNGITWRIVLTPDGTRIVRPSSPAVAAFAGRWYR